jgi:hypothetical protein
LLGSARGRLEGAIKKEIEGLQMEPTNAEIATAKKKGDEFHVICDLLLLRYADTSDSSSHIRSLNVSG